MPDKPMKIEGFKEVKANLSRELKKLDNFSSKGLIEAAIFIRRDMEVTPPTVPVDTGNLRASWFTTLFKRRFKNHLIMGFSVNYAVWVHENIGATFQRPGSGAKFFESSLKRNINK